MKTELELKHLSDSEILTALDRLHSAECVTQAQFLVYINIIQDRELFAGEGYSSLHKYLMARFHYSKSSALRRMHAAGLGRKFPLAYTLLADGKLSLSHLQVLAPKMTVENSERLFEKAVRQSVEQLEESLAEEFPRPEAPDKLDPLGEDRFKFQFTADGNFLDKVRQAQALLGKKYPSGRLAHVFEEALDLLLKYEGLRKTLNCRSGLFSSLPIGGSKKPLGIFGVEYGEKFGNATAVAVPFGEKMGVGAGRPGFLSLTTS